MATTETELTCEARDAIRAYLLKLFAIPAVVISVLSFTLGYVFAKAAQASALEAVINILPGVTEAKRDVTEAKRDVTEAKLKITEAAQSVQASRTDASTAVANIQKELTEVRRVNDALSQQKSIMESARQTGDLRAAIIKSFTEDEDFKRQIIAATQRSGLAEYIRYDDAIYLTKVDGARNGWVIVNNPNNGPEDYVKLWGPEQVNYPDRSKFAIKRWK